MYVVILKCLLVQVFERMLGRWKSKKSGLVIVPKNLSLPQRVLLVQCSVQCRSQALASDVLQRMAFWRARSGGAATLSELGGSSVRTG